MIRSFAKLVDLVEERDSDGAEKHWRSYMRVTGEILLRNENLASSEVIDLFN
jgi:DNA-binding GntR family transcriptional regulator